MTQKARERLKSVSDVDWSGVDFVDFGSGVGRSLAVYEHNIGGRGVGIERSREKVAEAQRNGLAVVHGDIFKLPDVSVRYVTIDNVLEHLPEPDRAAQALEVALRLARDFVYIRHPSFEDEAYLAALGLKQYWTDWRGHPSHILLTDFMRWFRNYGVRSFVIHPVWAAWDSEDPSILPCAAPADQHDYDPAAHGSKPSVRFAKPVYRAYDIVAVLSPDVAGVGLEYRRDPETSDARPRVVVEPVKERRSWGSQTVAALRRSVSRTAGG